LGLVFSVDDVIMGACFHDFLAEITWSWASTQYAIFLAQMFFGI